MLGKRSDGALHTEPEDGARQAEEYASHAEAISDVADHIIGFYNSIRPHSKLGNMSPNAFKRESTSTKSIKMSRIT